MPNYFSSSQESAFALRANFTNANPSEFSIADFNGDGKLDVAISYFMFPLEDRAAPIRLLAGNGAGGFTDITAATFPNGAPSTVFGRESAMADFNGDGRADVFFGGHGYDAPPFPGEHNALMLSSGATAMINASDRLPNLNSNFTHSTEAGDIDGDGDIDIFVGNGANPSAYFLINDGQGNFTRDSSGLPAPMAAGMAVYDSEAFLDVDRDGDLDLFLGTSGAVITPNQLLINDGRGHFTAAPVAPPMPVTEKPIAYTQNVEAKSFDVNGDGLPDIVSSFTLYAPAGDAPRYVQVLINKGDKTFADETLTRLPASLQTGLWISRINVVDINGDGYLDMVMSNHTATPFYLHDGYGHFIEMPQSFSPSAEFTSRFPADFNGDGRMDLLVLRGKSATSEFYRVDFAVDRGTTQVGTAAEDGFMGDSDAETMSGGDGNDVIFGGAGQDYLRGDAGNDQIVGGADFDDVNGNMGDDTVHGGLGNDYSVGGKDNDVLFGDEGEDIVWGNLGNDTCDGGGGADQVRGGQGDDSVSGGAGNDFVSGDRGSDTISGGAGADIFHGSQDAGIDRVLDFHLAEGDRVQLDPGTTYTVSQVGADTVIDMGTPGNQMVLVGVQMSSLTTGWIFGA